MHTYDELAAGFGSAADPAPETMAGYYRWPGRDRERERLGIDGRRRGCATGRLLW